jgi:EmrB/QacA subfamily drug resistance transporter
MHVSYKWLAATVLILGGLMSFLDQTIVNIAISQLQHTFGADIHSIQWVVTAYLLAQGALTATTPYLAQRLGSKRAYLISLVAFTLGSALCGFAWNLPMLILFRILQGLGGAILFPLTLAFFFTIFSPAERGTAMAVMGLPSLVVPALGPVVGGYLITVASWRVIFFINVPIGIVAILLGMLVLRETRTAGAVRFDLPGFLTSAYGLAAVLYTFSQASTNGWESPSVLALLSSGGLALVAFVAIELVTVHCGGRPLVDLRLFANRTFSAGNAALVVIAASLFSILFLLPLYLQTLRGLSALQASFILLPQALATILSTLLGGRLVDHLDDTRPVMIPGLVLLAVGTWLLTRITLLTPYWQFDLILVVIGLAFGMILQPLTVATMAPIRDAESVANGSTLITVVRAVAGSLGLAVLATLVQTQTQEHIRQLEAHMLHPVTSQLQQQAFLLAMQDVFFLTALLTILALIITALLQKKQSPFYESKPASTSYAEKEASTD